MIAHISMIRFDRLSQSGVEYQSVYDLRDLRIPPSNHLEKLRQDGEGRYSIRVNNQWRLCFVWTTEGAKEVEFCDYH